jgi:nucleoside-diphosphate-sugar epimerase
LAYFSSFQVFGRWAGLVYDYDQPNPSNMYGRSHLLGESLVREFGLQYKRQVGVFRPTNIFGVNSSPATIRWHRVPADFCLQAVRDSRIVIKGDPNENRDFLPVGLLAKRFVEYAERIVTWDAIPRVIGSGMGMSIFDMAKLVALEAERSFELDVAVISARKAEGRPRSLSIKGDDSLCPLLVSSDGVDIRASIRLLLKEARRRVNKLDGR